MTINDRIYTIVLPLQYLYHRRTATNTYQQKTLELCRQFPKTYKKLLYCSLFIYTIFTSAAFFWYSAVSLIPLGDATAIYNSSCFFAYILSVLLLKERFKIGKAIAVLISVIGIAFISLYQPDHAKEAKRMCVGYILATLSSLCVGLYEVIYKKLVVPR